MKKLLIGGLAIVLILLILAIAAKKQNAPSSGPLLSATPAAPQAPAPIPPSQPRAPRVTTPGTYDFTLEHGDRTRKYMVYAPPLYHAVAHLPVVLAFHGGGGNSARSREFYDIEGLAAREGFLVVYPEGTGSVLAGEVFGSWNAGRCCAPAYKENVDDVGFVRAMIAKLEGDFSMNASRIYAIGASNGSLISFRLACEASDLLAGIAVTAGQDAFDDCRPARPVPVLYMHGTGDECAPYEGGACGGCMAKYLTSVGIPTPAETWACESAPDYVDEWRAQNGCLPQKSVVYQKGKATCEAYAGCAKDVAFCTITGMGHMWPGKEAATIEACKTAPDGLLCQKWKAVIGESNTTDLDANELAWKFFKGQPLQ